MTTPIAPAAPEAGSLRAIGLMIFAMGGFAVSDMFIKLCSGALPPGQIILFLGIGGTVIFGGLSWQRGLALIGPDLRHPAVLMRMAAEAAGTIGFVSALTLISLSMASAIAQATPLAITLGAGLILREPVGWRRWGAVLVGFCGVLIMLRPDGSDAGSGLVNVGALFALLGVAGLSTRDLVTRMVPERMPSLVLATYGFVALIPAGLALLAVSGGFRVPDGAMMVILGAMVVAAVIAYFALTMSLRLGAMAVVAPFRYTRLIFAFSIGALVFNERLTAPILLGAGLVAIAGVYTFYREDRQRRRARRAAQAG